MQTVIRLAVLVFTIAGLGAIPCLAQDKLAKGEAKPSPRRRSSTAFRWS